jgi:hypothetical protein
MKIRAFFVFVPSLALETSNSKHQTSEKLQFSNANPDQFAGSAAAAAFTLEVASARRGLRTLPFVPISDLIKRRKFGS